MASQSDILQRLRNALTLSDPSWDSSIGTAEYKIMEAVAAEIASAYNDGILLTYHLDVDSKTGTELDDFCALFGIYRLLGKRAVGTISFQRGTPADQDYDIPIGTQVAEPSTSVTPAIYFQTTSAGTLAEGQVDVEIPIEASVSGASGNVIAGAITVITSSLSGASSVTNQQATVGGRDPESDADLRARWKRTVFRNLSGTQSNFIALCLDDPSVTKAIVIGAQNRATEQLQVVTGTPPTVTSQLTDAKYTYPPGGEFFGLDFNQQTQLTGIRDTDYAYNQSVPVVFDVLNTTTFPVNQIVDIQTEYTPICSRNDPASGLTNKVDIFVAGTDSNDAFEQVTMDHSKTFSSSGAMNRVNWIREDDTTNPTLNNYFMPLMRTPVILIPDQITVGVTTYVKDTDYWFVRDITTNRGSTYAQDGIEWKVSGAPANGIDVIVDYQFNAAISRINELVKAQGLVGMDNLVHAGTPIYLKFYLAVVYNLGVQSTSVDQQINIAVTTWLENKGFGDNVQIADLIDTVMNVQGVDNVRLVKISEDSTNYAIQKLALDGTILTHYTTDIYLKSNEYPINTDVVTVYKASNTF